MSYLLILLCGAINRFRGMDKIIPYQKLVCYLLFGAVGLTFFAQGAPMPIGIYVVIFCAVVATVAFWRQQGRGQYLATVHGRMHKGQISNYLASALADAVYGQRIYTSFDTPHGYTLMHNRTWAAIAMAGLGLYSTVGYAILALIQWKWWLLPVALLPVLEGVIYWLCYYLPLAENKKTEPAEFITGLLHGVVLWTLLH